MSEEWIAEELWRRYQEDELLDEDCERGREERPQLAVAASAAASGGAGKDALCASRRDDSW